MRASVIATNKEWPGVSETKASRDWRSGKILIPLIWHINVELITPTVLNDLADGVKRGIAGSETVKAAAQKARKLGCVW
jgi:hypothetical protein